jgi:hypothetical protein
MKLHVFIILLGMLILVGCATLNKEECLGGKWREIGVKDGINGEQSIQIEKHRKACAEHGIQPDEKLYMSGHAEGLQEYCQIDNAFRNGLEGRQYKGVCPLDIHTLFMYYNRAAYAVYETRKEIENKHNSISAAQNRLGNKKTSAADKDHIRSDIQKLESELDKLRNDLHDLERGLDKLMVEAREGKQKSK